VKKLIWKNVWQLLAALAFLLLVWAIAYVSVGNELLVPSLPDSLAAVGKLLVGGAFWRALGMSLLRALFAFSIAFVFAAVFAIISYLSPSFCNFFAPIVSAMRSLPVLAVLLILLAFLGAGQAPIAVAFLSLFPMLYTGVLAALSGIDKQLIAVSRVHGARLWKRITHIYLPLSSPYVLREAGGALSYSLKLIVSAEVLSQTARSLGGMMQEARVYAEMPTLFALVTVTFLVGLLLELAMTAVAVSVEKRVK
jgi:NitT/TauT family transport system permease protein